MTGPTGDQEPAGVAGAHVLTAAPQGDAKEFQAEVTTGANRLYGQPLMEFDFMPSQFRERFGFETMGVLNPDGPGQQPSAA